MVDLSSFLVILPKTYQVLILFYYIFIFMKACHKSKTKTLLVGVSKILLAAYTEGLDHRC